MCLLCLEKSDGTDPRLGIVISWPLPVVTGPMKLSPFPAPTGAEPRRLVKIYLIKIKKKKKTVYYLYMFRLILNRCRTHT